MPTRTARLLSRGNGYTPEEEEEILQGRRRDINLYGYGYAFEKDSLMSYEKYEYQKNNGRLRRRDLMDIKGIDDLDIGMSNIGIEGEVTYAMTPRNVTGDNEKGHYDFWSQFIVVEDKTGSIGCSVSIEKEEYKLAKGHVARVNGKLEEYKNKNGEMVKKLKGKLIAISKGDKVTDVQQESAEGYFEEKAKVEKEKPAPKEAQPPIDKWEAKDLRIARECAVKAVTELVIAKIMPSKEFFNFADTIVKYIYNGNGKKEATKEENLALARHIAGGGKLELKPGKKGLLEDDEPGSSPDNAIPFKGKKKELKKVATADDFIAPEDLPE